MAKKPKEDISEVQTKTIVPELQTASGLNPNMKNMKFANDEPTIHFEVEKAPANTAPEISIPTQTPPPAAIAPKKEKAPRLAVEREPLPNLAIGSTRQSSVARVMNTTPIYAAQRGQPFWPLALLLVAAGGGYYLYQEKHGGKEQKSVSQLAGEAGDRDPASITMGGQPDPLINKDMAPRDGASDIKGLMTPVQTNFGQEDLGTFVLKSDSDDFRVLVNGKEMPVISGKISLPLHQKYSLRFLRRGYKDIKMVAETKKAETKELLLKFEKGSETQE